MLKPDVIIRSNRRSLSLTISKNGELIVRAPKKLSLEYIFSFINQKEKWVVNKQKQIQNAININTNLINYHEYMFCGKTYNKLYINKIKEVSLTENGFVVPSNLEPEKEQLLMMKWFKKATEEVVGKRIKYFSDLMQIDYETCKIINSKSKWGSCDLEGNIKFNLRLSMLPHKVIDYIVIHELSHLLEFNHSKKFYQIIESIMPDYQNCRVYLKKNNFILQLFR